MSSATVPVRQPWLFAPERPLVERLGRDFFRQAPTGPGVYLMKDAAGEVLYVGKARNLRQRLASYRVANPDRLPRRHLRLLREVVRIDHETTPTEAAALTREAVLLRTLRPRFNRAGVWPAPARFLVWRLDGDVLLFTVEELPPPGWHRSPSLGGAAAGLRAAIARLLWLGLHPGADFTALPEGWAQGRFRSPGRLTCGRQAADVHQALEHLFWSPSDSGPALLEAAAAQTTGAFDHVARLADLETIRDFMRSSAARRRPEPGQPPLL